MGWLFKNREIAASVEADDDDGDDPFGTDEDEDEDEDFNLFDKKSKSKNAITTKLNRAKTISEASVPATSYQHHHPNPATSDPKLAATGLFANSGKQDINEVTNQGFIQGVLNGSVFLGHHNSIIVYHHC